MSFVALVHAALKMRSIRPSHAATRFQLAHSPPVVESGDTGPFFHNHTVNDLESAVAFYGT